MLLLSFLIILQSCYKRSASQKNQHIASHVAMIFCNHLAKLLQKIIASKSSATSPLFLGNLNFDKSVNLDSWLTLLSKWRLSKKRGLVADGCSIPRKPKIIVCRFSSVLFSRMPPWKKCTRDYQVKAFELPTPG
jgi:hypothetical protein